MGHSLDEYGAWTPAGRVRILMKEDMVVAIVFDGSAPSVPPPDPVGPWFEAYADRVFLSIPPVLSPPATAVEEHVRDVLTGINPGQVLTYGHLASLVGSHPRAVASVLRANRLPVMVPCHRVTAARGLGGFSSGLKRKVALLLWEGWTPGIRLSEPEQVLLHDVRDRLGLPHGAPCNSCNPLI